MTSQSHYFRSPTMLAAAAIAIGSLAALAPGVVLVSLVALGVGALIWFYPIWGVYFVLLATLLGEFARLDLFGLHLLPLDLLAPLIVLLFFLRLVVYRTAWQIDHVSAALLAFLGLALVSLLAGAADLTQAELLTALLYWFRFASLAGLFFFVRQSGFGHSQITHSVILAGVGLALVGFVLLQHLPDFAEAGLTELGWDPHIGRLTSTWLDPNFAAGAFAFCLALAAGEFLGPVESASWLKFPITSRRLWLILAAVILLIALLLTYSRSGLLALAISGCTLALLRSRALIWLGIVLVVVGLATSPRLQERVGELAQSAASLGHSSQQVLDPTAQLRVDSWVEAVAIWSTHPLLGTGYGTYAAHQSFVSAESHAASGSDSSLLTIAATMGVAGVLFFLNFWLQLVRAALAHRAWGVLAAGAGLFVHAIFVNSLFFAPLLVYWFLTAAAVPGVSSVSSR